jgi:hydroxylamine reductase
MDKKTNRKEAIKMDNKMFCFQCEQTAGCTGCRGNAGVCGKKSDTANLQDKLTGALIGLARACGSAAPVPSTAPTAIIDGLFTTVTNVNFDDESVSRQIERRMRKRRKLTAGCAPAAHCEGSNAITT